MSLFAIPKIQRTTKNQHKCNFSRFQETNVPQEFPKCHFSKFKKSPVPKCKCPGPRNNQIKNYPRAKTMTNSDKVRATNQFKSIENIIKLYKFIQNHINHRTIKHNVYVLTCICPYLRIHDSIPTLIKTPKPRTVQLQKV